MNKKEVKNLVFSFLEFSLETDGYKFNKSQEQFELKKGDFSYFIGISVVDRHPQYEIAFTLSIRHNKIEKIANDCADIRPENCKFTRTIVVLFSYFTSGKRNAFIIVNENDLDRLKEYFTPLYNKTVKPFIERTNTLEKLSLFVNKCIEEGNLSIPITVKLYARSLILSKLTNNIDFDNKALYFKNIIQNFPDHDRKILDQTYMYLKLIQQ